MVFNRDCRKLSKIKYFFTFLFVLRPIFAAVVPKIKPEVLACIDVRASCVTVSDIFRLPPAYLEERVER